MPSIKRFLWPAPKKGIGSPLYVEEDGPILGVLDDIFLDAKTGEPLAYRIIASGLTLEIPAESVYETPAGFVYRSPWFTEAENILRNLESQELLMPELLFSSSTTATSDKKLVDDAVARSPGLKKQVDQARALYRDLLPKIEALEKEKFKLVQEIAELTEGVAVARLSSEVYRDRFVILKRRLQVVEASLHRAEMLKTRLQRMPWIGTPSNGHGPSNGNGHAAPAPGVPGVPAPTAANPEDLKRIKKFRVLKTERDLKEREQRVLELEKKGGVAPPAETAKVLSENFRQLNEAYARGGEPAVRAELEKVLRTSTPAAVPAAAPAGRGPGAPPGAPAPLAPVDTAGQKRCPVCGRGVGANDKNCPDCGADLGGSKPAPKNPPGGATDRFVKGGGVSKLGVLLLIGAGIIGLLHFLVR